MDRLNEAVQKVKAGQKGQARKLLREIVAAQPDHEAAWLWLAAAEETEAEKRRCLERALQLNPKNETTQQALARLGTGEIPLPQVADIVPPSEAVFHLAFLTLGGLGELEGNELPGSYLF